MKTRYQKQHESIHTVHPRPFVKKKNKKNDRRAKAAQPKPESGPLTGPQTTALLEFIKTEGIQTFFANLFSGGVQTTAGLVDRGDVVAMINRNNAFRKFISNRWRKEDDHNHEWVPCTYLSEMVKKAVANDDFRYLWLSYNMRSLTKAVIFKPRKIGRLYISVGGHDYTVLQAHPGGLKFRTAPGNPLGAVMAGIGYEDGARLTYGQGEFHTDIIQALAYVSSPAQLVTRVKAVCDDWCWDGTFPVNNHAAPNEIWPYYYQHNTPIQLVFPGAAAWPAAVGAGVTPFNPVANYNAMDGNFRTWQDKGDGRKMGKASWD